MIKFWSFEFVHSQKLCYYKKRSLANSIKVLIALVITEYFESR